MMKKQSFHIGNIVNFGILEKKEIEWIILSIDGEEALITSCYGVALHAYNNDPAPSSWRTCSLRSWLNKDFLLSHFSQAEQAEIHAVILAEKESDISFSGDELSDKVFVLSEDEAKRYFCKQSDRVLLYHDGLSGTWAFRNGLMTTCRWWMRGNTGDFNGRNCAPVCDCDGSFGGYQVANSPRMAVRPAMWVSLNALRLAVLPAIDHMNIRLKKGDLGTITLFSDGYEDQAKIYAKFVDYETQEEYVLFNEQYAMFHPTVAKVAIDRRVGNTIRKKAYTLCSMLSRMPYDEVANQLSRQLDENRVKSWMNQVAWSPSAGEYKEAEEGTIIQFGKRSPEKGKKREAISWIVLRSSGSKALLISEKGIKCSTFMDNDSEDCDWEHSLIRNWLNTTFYKNCFSQEERSKIQHCMTECGDLLGRMNENNKVYDYVFLLNDAEASLFFFSDAARKISGTPDDVSFFRNLYDHDTGDWWWLRSPGDTSEYVCCVDPDGCVDRHGRWVHSDVCAIRPVILIDLSYSDNE